MRKTSVWYCLTMQASIPICTRFLSHVGGLLKVLRECTKLFALHHSLLRWHHPLHSPSEHIIGTKRFQEWMHLDNVASSQIASEFARQDLSVYLRLEPECGISVLGFATLQPEACAKGSEGEPQRVQWAAPCQLLSSCFCRPAQDPRVFSRYFHYPWRPKQLDGGVVL